MTSKSKGILRAVTPLTALILIAAGARLLPSVFGKEEAVDEASSLSLSRLQKASPSPGKGKKPAAPKVVDAKTQAALQKVVGSQLSAFAKNDFSQALRYSAPEFRRNYSPDAFRQMVQTGYAGLLKYKTLRFVPARLSADVAMMPVFLKAQNGTEAGYLYILRKETSVSLPNQKDDGKPAKAAPKTSGKAAVWYIEGVSPLRSGGYPGADSPAPGRITDVREI